MSVSGVKSAVQPVVVAAFVALGFSASAQQTIQYSRPAAKDPAALASPTPILPGSHFAAPSSVGAPSSIFDEGATADFDMLPTGPQPIILNGNSAQWQRFLDSRRNWTLMTPETILGVPTPESILGITDPNDDPRLSAEERYLRRQDRQMEMAATNAIRREDATFDRQGPLFDRATDRFRNRKDSQLFDALLDSPSPLLPGANRDFKPADSQDVRGQPGVNASDNTWTSPFGVQVTPATQTPEQLEGMERFRAMLDSVPPEKPAAAASTPRVDPYLQPQPVFNPVGQAVAPVQSDISRPLGLTPLAGVGQPPPAKPKNTSLVDPPPWLSDPSKPTFQQRQF